MRTIRRHIDPHYGEKRQPGRKSSAEPYEFHACENDLATNQRHTRRIFARVELLFQHFDNRGDAMHENFCINTSDWQALAAALELLEFFLHLGDPFHSGQRPPVPTDSLSYKHRGRLHHEPWLEQ